MNQLALLFLLSVALSAATGTRSFPHPEGDSSPEERVQRVLETLAEEEGKIPFRSRTYLITQPELNAYLQARLWEQERSEIRAVSVKLGEQSLTTSLLVDLDQLDLSGGGTTVGLFGALLSGTRKLEIDADWTARNGVGTYRISGARLNGVALPQPLVQWIVTSLANRYDPGFDPQAPVELPHRIQTIRLTPGRLTIITG